MPRLSTLVRKLIKWIPDKPIVSAFSLFILLAEEGDHLCFGEVLPPGPCFKFKAFGVVHWFGFPGQEEKLRLCVLRASCLSCLSPPCLKSLVKPRDTPAWWCMPHPRFSEYKVRLLSLRWNLLSHAHVYSTHVNKSLLFFSRQNKLACLVMTSGRLP